MQSFEQDLHESGPLICGQAPGLLLEFLYQWNIVISEVPDSR